MKRMACAVALAAGAGLSGTAALPALAEPKPATAAAGLQVNIVPPGTVSGDAAIPLDVKFHGGNIRVIELIVDGARLTRQALSTRDGRGVVHFSLDPSLLSEGSHEVLVKAYEADGTCATTTTQIMVAAGDVNALARFEWPKRNAEVQGNVPIKVKIDPSIVDPYVTYTVDNDFLAFRNYAPYTYNWDSTKVGNGLHTVGIEVMDGRTLQVVQKLTLAITVKNLGGFTKIPPSADHPARAAAGTVADTIEGVAQSTSPEPSMPPLDAAVGISRASRTLSPIGTNHRGTTAALRSNAPLRNLPPASHVFLPVGTDALNALPGSTAPFVIKDLPLVSAANTLNSAMTAIGRPNVQPPAPNPGGQHIAPGFSALAANPADLMPPTRPAIGLARQSARYRRVGGIALRPSSQRVAVHSAQTAPAAAPVRPSSERQLTHTAPATAHQTAFRTGNRKTFDVAFNNTLINFDVAPRVENGLPLAPFRAIFEHNGGTVKWYNGAKVVRAFDSTHEIEIKIGDKEAKVNNQPVSMEATPYLDHGRTIVPLSFVRDAMDLKVTFDQETGHLMIEKK